MYLSNILRVMIEMGRVCNVWRCKKCVQNFGTKTSKEETNWKCGNSWADNIKMGL